MNPLQRVLIEKTGNDNGFEYVVASDAVCVTLASARHSNRVLVGVESGGYQVRFQTSSSSLLPELQRSFPATLEAWAFWVATEAELAALLRRAAILGRTLPNQLEEDYQNAVEIEMEGLAPSLRGTEVERQIRLRLGQDRFRAALMDYWGGACAVTGVAIPEVLRASHAKPWAECATDAERLDVFNGFLLSANLDALFDRYLISFSEEGRIVFSRELDIANLQKLGIDTGTRLRWLATEHQLYLHYHRQKLK